MQICKIKYIIQNHQLIKRNHNKPQHLQKLWLLNFVTTYIWNNYELTRKIRLDLPLTWIIFKCAWAHRREHW